MGLTTIIFFFSYNLEEEAKGNYLFVSVLTNSGREETALLPKRTREGWPKNEVWAQTFILESSESSCRRLEGKGVSPGPESPHSAPTSFPTATWPQGLASESHCQAEGTEEVRGL